MKFLLALSAVANSVFAAGVPEQIHLAFAGQDANGFPNGMAANWFTQDSTATSTVAYGLSASSLAQQATGSATNYYTDYGYHHTVTLSGLQPKTTYFYKVGDAAGGFSAVKSFVSAANTADDSYSVAVFGDMGWLGTKERPLVLPAVEGLSKNWSAVPTRGLLEKMVNNQQADFLLHVGDISYADDAFATDLKKDAYETVYNGYMNWMENLTSTRPWMVLPGNHESECHSAACLLDESLAKAEGNFTAYNARFTMPSASSDGVLDMWYSFNVGPVHWVIVNSETDWAGAAEETKGDSGILPAGGFGRPGQFLAWLEADLKAAAANSAVRPWIVAAGHRPFKEIEAPMGALFSTYGVDLYFCGHTHSYVRSGPTTPDFKLDRSAMVTANHYHQATGCTYVVVGSAGCDEMDYVYDPHTNTTTATLRERDLTNAVPEGTVVYQDVTSSAVSAGSLKVTKSALAWTLFNSVTGATIDQFQLTK